MLGWREEITRFPELFTIDVLCLYYRTICIYPDNWEKKRPSSTTTIPYAPTTNQPTHIKIPLVMETVSVKKWNTNQPFKICALVVFVSSSLFFNPYWLLNHNLCNKRHWTCSQRLGRPWTLYECWLFLLIQYFIWNCFSWDFFAITLSTYSCWELGESPSPANSPFLLFLWHMAKKTSGYVCTKFASRIILTYYIIIESSCNFPRCTKVESVYIV